ncbi:antibiotic biosynthesis monooxygenase [bacterium]|nr:MAG: antibiotic biosynthesis monooxygenase [bacterium]
MSGSVITRIWHGKTKAEHAEEYLEFVVKTGVRDYKKTPGNLSVQILRRIDGAECHFWTVTRWNSVENIKKFAGEDYEKAHYYPEDKNYLLEFEPNVIHCETFDY